jgi:hypothetical protein
MALWENSAIYLQLMDEQQDMYRRYREHDAMVQQRLRREEMYRQWLVKQWISQNDLSTAVDKLDPDPMRLPPGF